MYISHMATRKEQLSIGEYYHIYTRGVDKRKIFCDNSDHTYFLKLLEKCNSDTNVRIDRPHINSNNSKILTDVLAFTLMPNHIHIMMYEINDRGTSKYLHKILTGYAMYFNKKYKRTGRLFESVFKNKHINEDLYLRHLLNYIHFNCIKLVNKNYKSKELFNEKIELTQKEILFAKDYSYSSYGYYCGTRNNSIVTRKLSF